MRKPDVEKLTAARELIARPGGWTQGVYARDAKGILASFCSGAAVCFCWIGAAYRSHCGWIEISLMQDAIDTKEVERWNDAPERTQAEVVAAFDRAIELARAS